MCEYCDLDNAWVGEYLPYQERKYISDILGAWVMMDLEEDNDNFYIEIDSTNDDFKIKINYCPMCGRNLKEKM